MTHMKMTNYDGRDDNIDDDKDDYRDNDGKYDNNAASVLLLCMSRNGELQLLHNSIDVEPSFYGQLTLYLWDGI